MAGALDLPQLSAAVPLCPRPCAFLQFLVLLLARSALQAGGRFAIEALAVIDLEIASLNARFSPLGVLVLPKTCRS
jgi:hypothetical protein